MASQFLSRNEEALLKELNRMIDWSIDNNRSLESLLITKKQANLMRSIVKKRQNGKLFNDLGEVPIDLPSNTTATKYRGVELYVKETRKHYSKRDILKLPV